MRDERERNHATIAHLRRLREDHRRGASVRPTAGHDEPLATSLLADSASSKEEIADLLSKEGYLYKKSKKGARANLLPIHAAADAARLDPRRRYR